MVDGMFFSAFIQFGTMSPQEIAQCGEFEVCAHQLYDPNDRKPVRNGVLDRRLVRFYRLSLRREVC